MYRTKTCGELNIKNVKEEVATLPMDYMIALREY